MFLVSRPKKQKPESVIQDTKGNNVINVSGENLSGLVYFTKRNETKRNEMSKLEQK